MGFQKMAFVRIKNKKVYFNEMFISNIFSKLYFHVYGDEIYKYRDEIYQLTNQVFNNFDSRYGSSEHVEIFLEEIYEICKKYLTKDFLVIQFDQFYLVEKNSDVKWNLKVKTNQFKFNQKEYNEIILEITQDDWLIALENFSIFYMRKSNFFFFFDVFKDQILKIKGNYLKNDEDWFDFLIDNTFNFLKYEPRLIYLISGLSVYKKLCDLIGISWLTYFFSPTEQIQSNRFNFNFENIEDFFDSLNFSTLSKEFFITTESKTLQEFCNIKTNSNIGLEEELYQKNILDKIFDGINLEREFLITYRGEQNLIKNNALCFINEKHWKSIGKTSKTCYEPLQWLFLRTAIKLTLLSEEKTLENRIDLCIQFYNLLSNLTILFPDNFYREINKERNNFFKDFSLILKDDYDDIQRGVFEAITSTKWSGNVNLDFTHVRRKGSVIRNGYRISNGISPYLEVLEGLVKTQGRSNEEFPISVSLPDYHYELFELFNDSYSKNNKNSAILEEVENDFLISKQLNKSKGQQKNNMGNGIIKNIVISDLLLQRSFNERENLDWYLLDTYYFENFNINLNTTKGYLEAEKMILNGEIPKKHYKKYKARLVFTKIINSVKSNFINLILSGNYYKYEEKQLTNLGTIYKNSKYFQRIGFNIAGFYLNKTQLNQEQYKNKVLKWIDNSSYQIDEQNLIKALNALYVLKKIFEQYGEKQHKNFDVIFELVGFQDLLSVISNHNLHSQQFLLNRILIDFFKVNDFVENNLYSTAEERIKFNDKIVYLSKNKPVSTFKKINEDIHTGNFIISNSLDFFEMSNTFETQLGQKHFSNTIISKGFTRDFFSTNLVLDYNNNIVEHEKFSKIFNKKPNFSFKDHGFERYYVDSEFLNNEIEKINLISPFFNGGVKINIARHLQINEIKSIIIKSWLSGISIVNFV